MSDEIEQSEPQFAPHSRYAANKNPRTRWLDRETGQEDYRAPVGVNALLDAGATFDDPDAVRLPASVEIGPYQPPSGRWIGKIAYRCLDPRIDEHDVVTFVSTRSVVVSEVLDERPAIVEWIGARVPEFRRADVEDARQWSERRRRKRQEGVAHV